MTFPGGATTTAKIVESKELPSHYTILVGVDALSSVILVADHAKRFAVLDRKQWDDSHEKLVGDNPIVLDAEKDSDGHLLIPAIIDKEIVKAIVDTGCTNVTVSEGFAERHKIRPDRMIEGYVTTGVALFGLVDSLTFSLVRDSQGNTGPANIFPDTVLGQSVPPIVGTSAFKNYMAVFDFAKNKVWLSR